MRMNAQQQMTFLQQKIQEIGSAIFFNLSDSVLKFPTSIVTTLKVDDFGYVWFYVQKPKQNLREFEKEFPVRLDFYRKGKNCFLQVTGKAWVVTDPEEINTLLVTDEDIAGQVNNETNNNMVLVKVKMQRAEYHETQSVNRNNWWQSAVNTLFTWFRNSNNYPSNTYFPAS